ncbi:MAG: chemotaxis-specific protein-glutamate methyltransferase CheB [Gemmatimonas sp.]
MSGSNGSNGAAARRVPARVLVADDSAFMRRLVSDVIAESGEFDVVGTARDGVHALAQVHALNPDIVTLDVDMPGQDGLEALRQIMRDAPRPVVMLSAGAAVDTTLRALELGAVEFVRKPSGAISLDIDGVREQLLDALRAAACANRLPLLATSGRGVDVHANGDATIARADRPRTRLDQERAATQVVCIAASTGGPAALARVVPMLPRFAEAAVLIVQHMPAGFTRSLAQRLDGGARLMVREAEHLAPVLAGHAYLAPGGFHLRVGVVSGVTCCLLDTEPTLWGVRPAADHLFTSAALVYGAACTGVVLTGMGCDGAAGLFAIRHAGGRGVVQDRESSVIAGMPMAALQHAGAEHVVTLDRISDTIANLIDAPLGAELSS